MVVLLVDKVTIILFLTVEDSSGLMFLERSPCRIPRVTNLRSSLAEAVASHWSDVCNLEPTSFRLYRLGVGASILGLLESIVMVEKIGRHL